LAALLVKVIAQILYGLIPESISAAIRYVMTRVLPLPGPAITSKGPSVWKTAFCCEGVSSCENVLCMKDTLQTPTESRFTLPFLLFSVVVLHTARIFYKAQVFRFLYGRVNLVLS
jgi:hypothetical protein